MTSGGISRTPALNLISKMDVDCVPYPTQNSLEREERKRRENEVRFLVINAIAEKYHCE